MIPAPSTLLDAARRHGVPSSRRAGDPADLVAQLRKIDSSGPRCLWQKAGGGHPGERIDL